jgi:hypothetical protein
MNGTFDKAECSIAELQYREIKHILRAAAVNDVPANADFVCVFVFARTHLVCRNVWELTFQNFKGFLLYVLNSHLL